MNFSYCFLAASILHSNHEQRKYLMDGTWAPIKSPNCVPHDVGCPGEQFSCDQHIVMIFLFH